MITRLVMPHMNKLMTWAACGYDDVGTSQHPLPTPQKRKKHEFTAAACGACKTSVWPFWVRVGPVGSRGSSSSCDRIELHEDNSQQCPR